MMWHVQSLSLGVFEKCKYSSRNRNWRGECDLFGFISVSLTIVGLVVKFVQFWYPKKKKMCLVCFACILLDSFLIKFTLFLLFLEQVGDSLFSTDEAAYCSNFE